MEWSEARKTIVQEMKDCSTAKHGALQIHAWQERPGDWLWEILTPVAQRPAGFDEEDAEISQETLAAYDYEGFGSWTGIFSW